MKSRVLFALVMGIVTTGIISFTLISVNLGFTDRFVSTWIRSWAIAYLVVVPAILLVGPVIQKLVDRILKQRSHLI